MEACFPNEPAQAKTHLSLWNIHSPSEINGPASLRLGMPTLEMVLHGLLFAANIPYVVRPLLLVESLIEFTRWEPTGSASLSTLIPSQNTRRSLASPQHIVEKPLFSHVIYRNVVFPK